MKLGKIGHFIAKKMSRDTLMIWSTEKKFYFFVVEISILILEQQYLWYFLVPQI